MLNAEDIKILISIIDVGSKNGLFRPLDFTIIGDLYNKLQKQLIQESNKE